jgi:hypothetical protein
MSAEKLYSEIFEEFDNAKNKAERIAVLRKYDHARFREFLNYVFNPNIKFDVEIPNYRIAVEPAGLNFTYLSAEMPKMYRFIVGHPMRADGLSPTKQKQLLVVILESLHKDEAALLVKLLKKNLGIKHLNLSLVLEAFPGI